MNQPTNQQVVGSTYQSLEVPNGATFIGSGKVAEVARAVRAYNAETVRICFKKAIKSLECKSLTATKVWSDSAVVSAVDIKGS